MELPEVKKLNTKNLSRIFDSTTESYKFFWFGSLLNKIIEGRDEISFEEIICDMISSAWYMVSEYHLNLGPKDTMENLILSLKETIDLKSNEKKEDIISFLTSTKDKEIESKKKRLANEVPYRMQSTFNGSIETYRCTVVPDPCRIISLYLLQDNRRRKEPVSPN